MASKNIMFNEKKLCKLKNYEYAVKPLFSENGFDYSHIIEVESEMIQKSIHEKQNTSEKLRYAQEVLKCLNIDMNDLGFPKILHSFYEVDISDTMLVAIYLELTGTKRTRFTRELDRIISTKSFRRMQYKTQVMVNSASDDQRTRLLHSLERSPKNSAHFICHARSELGVI